MNIESAIKQKKFYNDIHRAHINIIYTASFLNQQSNEVLKSYGLSVQQFNMLRILRGLRGKPATIKLLTERMLDKMSNASRLADKLLSKGYIERQSCQDDRRRVDITLTPAGLEVVNAASESIEQHMELPEGLFSPEEAVQLSHLLDRMREASGEEQAATAAQ